VDDGCGPVVRGNVAPRPVAGGCADWQCPPATNFFPTAYDRVIASHSHYDTLGVPSDASAEQIRAAYVERARRRHPDTTAASVTAPSDEPTMAELNAAYQVLRRRETRLDYDRSLRTPTASPDERRADDGPHDDIGDLDAGSEMGRSSPGARIAGRVLTPSGPARMPWRLMAVAALIGSAIVVASAAFSDPPASEPPDGIVRVGSCVTIESNGDAREVACAESPELVVGLVLPTGSTCPPAYATHRDRLGLGTLCVEAAG
jgi:DnaJ domain